MSYFALILLLWCFLKTFYYGIYEIKQKKNKSGGITVCLLAFLRTHFSKYYDPCFLYYFMIFNSAYFSGLKSVL